jgi:hypothetical protein
LPIALTLLVTNLLPASLAAIGGGGGKTAPCDSVLVKSWGPGLVTFWRKATNVLKALGLSVVSWVNLDVPQLLSFVLQVTSGQAVIASLQEKD